MSEKILSVSIAAYNLGNMIKENLDSFCNSKVINDIELIVTDDGSKDETSKIINEYAKKFPNSIKFIEQKNSGAGSTVNNGIKNATGKYFKMVDGDDWVETNNLEKLVEDLKKIDSDMVVNSYEIYSEKDNKIISVEKFGFENKKEINFESLEKYYDIPMHAVTYKTSIFQNNNIELDKKFYTDLEYLLYPIKYVKTCIYLEYPVYVYRVAREGQSISLKSMQKNKDIHTLVLNNLLNFYKSSNFKNGKKLFVSTRVAKMADNHLIILISIGDKKKTKEFIENLKNDYPEIYEKFKTGKKVKLLIYSGFLLFPLVKFLILKNEK